MAELNRHSYMLRLWRDHADAPWRATVANVSQPDEQHHFATLDALWDFLNEQTNSPPHTLRDINQSSTLE